MQAAPVGSLWHALGSGPTGKFELGSAPADPEASALPATGHSSTTKSVATIRPARTLIPHGIGPRSADGELRGADADEWPKR